MHELEYPFDPELVLQKQRRWRRQLLNGDTQWIDKRIAILGGATTSIVRSTLEVFLLNNGIRPSFYESQYNKYYEDAVFGNDSLRTFDPELIIIYTSSVNLNNFPDITDSDYDVERRIESEYSRLLEIWESLRKSYNSIVIQNNFELPYSVPLGNLDASVTYGLRHFIESLNEKIASYANNNPKFYINDIHYLSAKIGIDNWFNRQQYYSYKFAINYKYTPYFSFNIAKIIKAVIGKSKKCLVVDLDNTIWGGVIGDDGVENIKIGNETPLGEAYTEFQKYCLLLKQRGVLLAVNSKNSEDIAKSGFEHPDSVLKFEDFVSFKANWNSKDANMIDIADEINVGLDSLVFIDDNPVERELIREQLPMVAVPEVNPNDIFSYIQAIENNGYFETVALSGDDLVRNEQYISNKKRQDFEKSSNSYDVFLKSLEMEAEIQPFKEVYFNRIAQLTNKSNQFNLTTKRFTRADIESFSKKDNYITLYGRLKDRFGDNGLVSVVIGEIRNDELHIILWLMSCRVLKRNMEHAIFDRIVHECQNRGIRRIVGYYYKTNKNIIVSELYNSFGFEKISIQGEDSVWEFSIPEGYTDKNSYIVVV